MSYRLHETKHKTKGQTNYHFLVFINNVLSTRKINKLEEDEKF